MEPKKLEVEIGLLSVDLENFRIGDQETTRAAYQAMIAEEGDDLANLADDIIQHGLSPAELFIVCPDPEKPKHYIICEGNRRLTAIRLLESPALSAETSVHKRFMALSKTYAKAPIKKLSCVVVENKEAALLWIERKHLDLGGRGIAKWGAYATGRADAFRGKIRASRAVLDHLNQRRLLTKSLETKLARQTTNLDRVFQMPYLSSALGVKIEKGGDIVFGNGDQARGDDLLLRMVKTMAADGFTVDNIRHMSDRMDFIDGFAEHAVSAPDAAADKKPAAVKTAAAQAAANSKVVRRRVPSPLERTTLALKGRENVFAITEPRLNALYDEALHLNPETHPNSAAILTRVFLELSTDYFLTTTKAAIPAIHKDKGRRHWSDIGITLKEKIAITLKSLDPSDKEPALKDARTARSKSDVLHSVEALHDFIHQLKADPDPKEVKRIWSRWHPYLAHLYERIAALKK